MNKYRERILSMGKKKGARLVIPEIHDQRIQKASQELVSMGFQVLNHEDYKENMASYLDYIQQKSFADNWPDENLRENISMTP